MAVLLSLAGCSAVGSANSGPASDAPGGILIRVENHRPVDLTVYLVRDGTHFRLGTVTALTSHTFPVRSNTFGGAPHFRLVARPFGDRRVDPIVSREVPVDLGRIAEWSVEQSAVHSTLVIR